MSTLDRKACGALAVLFWCCGLAAAQAPPAADAPSYPVLDFSDHATYRVERVVDANTIEVLLSGTPVGVDLIGVRIPPSEDTRSAAVAALDRMLTGELVYLVPDPAAAPTELEIPERAYAFRGPDGLWINIELVRQGLCKIDAQPDFQHRALFEAYQKRARLAARGVWNPDSGRASAPPKPAVEARGEEARQKDEPKKADEPIVYVTRSGKKYHLSTCKYCTDTNRPLPLSEAAVKYGPCRVCKPPSPADNGRRP